MELLEFKHKMFDLCGVSEISQIRDVLYNAALSQDIEIFDGYNGIIKSFKDNYCLEQVAVEEEPTNNDEISEDSNE